MSEFVEVNIGQYRLVVALRYLNASEAIWKGLKKQRGTNDFHFLVTLRSFVEYTRRGIWFLVWASEEKLKRAEHLTFRDAGSPALQVMDAMINEALGQGKASPLMNKLSGIDEPFLNCLHALTHGNPVSARMMGIGLDKIFNTESLLTKAELDLNLFRILLYRRMAGDEIDTIWKMLSSFHNRPIDMRANALIAAKILKQSGNVFVT